MKTTIVTTTIHVPHLLHAYADNAERFGHDELDFVVVGDKKTPSGTEALCTQLGQRFATRYFDPQAQEALLGRYGNLAEYIPYNCIQRRNVGILQAYAQGAEVIITIDDDNFVTQGDYVRAQQIVGTRQALPTVHSTSGWYNVCGDLAVDDEVPLYHRGYPHSQRWREKEAFVSRAQQLRPCAVNAGFWLDDPDIGALDRMQRQPTVRGRKPGAPERFYLGHGTWSPFNSQNTALHGEAVAAYFLSPFIGRYDDIWASYVVAHIADHLDWAICFGEPWVRQARNPHDLMRDFDQERLGMQLTDGFCAALRGIRLQGKTWAECFGEVVRGLDAHWQLEGKQAEAYGTQRAQMLKGMRLWHEACALAKRDREQAQASRQGASKRNQSHAIEPEAYGSPLAGNGRSAAHAPS